MQRPGGRVASSLLLLLFRESNHFTKRQRLKIQAPNASRQGIIGHQGKPSKAKVKVPKGFGYVMRVVRKPGSKPLKGDLWLWLVWVISP